MGVATEDKLRLGNVVQDKSDFSTLLERIAKLGKPPYRVEQLVDIKRAEYLSEKYSDEVKATVELLYSDLVEECYHEIGMLVRELIANSITYGSAGGEHGKFYFEIYVDGDDFIFHACDDGAGFDLRNVDNPRTPENLMKESGRGILVAAQYADIFYNEKGNEVIAVKNLGKE